MFRACAHAKYEVTRSKIDNFILKNLYDFFAQLFSGGCKSCSRYINLMDINFAL